ncbi:MAG TPA: glycosyltransferase family 87 protein [Gemmatimonadales bacterium]|nr:glycosyltransferase family 87 protein [Gemmatimonadales bacterium]
MLTLQARRAVWILGVLYAAVVVPVGIRKGGDFVQELGLSERLLAGPVPLYTHNPPTGVFWPPFTIAALVPFALVARASLALAQGLWAVANVALLGWSLTRLARRAGWRPVVLAVLAVAQPLQGNFEHQNVLVVLLALVVAALDDLAAGHEQRAGVWIGIATAVKLFPGLLLVYLAHRRRWRACATGAAVALALTWGAMLRYGPLGAGAAVGQWIELGRAAERAQGFSFQPLGAWVLGLGGSPGAVWLVIAAVGALVAVALARGPVAAEPVYDVGLVTLLSVLLSPVGHYYYHLLAIPAWVAALTLPVPGAPALRRAWRAALAVAGVLLSGVLTFDHLYPAALSLGYRYNYVWGALLLLGALAAYRLGLGQASPQPA